MKAINQFTNISCINNTEVFWVTKTFFLIFSILHIFTVHI